MKLLLRIPTCESASGDPSIYGRSRSEEPFREPFNVPQYGMAYHDGMAEEHGVHTTGKARARAGGKEEN